MCVQPVAGNGFLVGFANVYVKLYVLCRWDTIKCALSLLQEITLSRPHSEPLPASHWLNQQVC